MKSALLPLIACVALALVAPLHAADDPRTATLTAADDERVSAMRAVDKTRLATLFSDDLRYAHSSGAVDSKTTMIDTLVSGRTKYVGYEYEERNFTFPAPNIALMTGRAHIQAETGTGKMDAVLGYLAVWREEQGQWHFLAWQSCKLPPPTPAVAK